MPIQDRLNVRALNDDGFRALKSVAAMSQNGPVGDN
jgi:hypothetical protein